MLRRRQPTPVTRASRRSGCATTSPRPTVTRTRHGRTSRRTDGTDMSWWVGGYIEAGMSAGGGQTAYLPFVFQAANKAQAEADSGAKLLAGPFSTQNAAQ